MSVVADVSKVEPQATVIIVSYNNEETIAECLSSVLSQQFNNFEVILVDNSSSDHTVSLVKSIYPSVRVHVLNRNYGFPEAVNIAATEARGRILAILNPDARAEPGWLQELVLVLQNYPDVGAVTSKVLLYDSHLINSLGMDIHISGLGLNRGLGQPDDGESDSIHEVPSIHGSSFACRKEVFFYVGGLDDSFFLYVDDVDFSLRLRLAGYKIYLSTESRVYHRYYLEVNPQKFYLLERNRILTLLGTFRMPTLVFLSPLWVVTEFLALIYSMARGKAFVKAKFRAWASVLNVFQSIKRKRKRNDRIRTITDLSLLKLFTFKISVPILWGAFDRTKPRQVITY